MSNPLTVSNPAPFYKQSLDDLQAYADRLNRMGFVMANGWEYFINTRTMPDGSAQRYLERRDCRRDIPQQVARQAARALEAPREPAFGKWHEGHAD